MQREGWKYDAIRARWLQSIESIPEVAESRYDITARHHQPGVMRNEPAYTR